MTSSVVRMTIGLAAWGACLAGALAIADVPGDLGHAICGPWGCAPSMQALLACHLAWFVALVPPAVMLTRWRKASGKTLRRVGLLAAGLAASALLAILLHERLVWWPDATELQQGHFWERYGYVVATTVDVPAVQVLLAGFGLWLAGRRRA